MYFQTLQHGTLAPPRRNNEGFLPLDKLKLEGVKALLTQRLEREVGLTEDYTDNRRSRFLCLVDKTLYNNKYNIKRKPRKK